MRTGEPIMGLEEREVWRDGRVTWVSTTKMRLRNREHTLIGIFGLSATSPSASSPRHTPWSRPASSSSWRHSSSSWLEDGLTGLYNRRGLDLLGGSAIDRAARNNTPTCVMFMDLDGLKAIDDGFGHAAGDAALVTAAGILRDAVRQTDAVGRIGGDEFAAVLVGITPAETGALCKRVRLAATSRPPGEHPLSVSIGFAGAHPSKLDTLDDLLAAADHAMYDGHTAAGAPSAFAELRRRRRAA